MILCRRYEERDAHLLETLLAEGLHYHAEGAPAFMSGSQEAFVANEKHFFEGLCDPNFYCFVVEWDDLVAGFAIIRVTQTPDIPIFVKRKVALVEQFLVTEAHRSKGLGKALLYHVQTWCQTQQLDSLDLFVHAFNADAHTFYKKFGFSDVLHRMSLPLVR